eukprot:m.42471 g.42471  ORF g.42471 m.42471 type:complete len:57 (-) comp9884_c0_seq3:380-550(-)
MGSSASFCSASSAFSSKFDVQPFTPAGSSQCRTLAVKHVYWICLQEALLPLINTWK